MTANTPQLYRHIIYIHLVAANFHLAETYPAYRFMQHLFPLFQLTGERAVLVNQHVEMVNLNRSHPSVIMWSLGNESLKYAEYFKKAGEVVKQMDPTRPRIFSQWGPDADNGELEVTNHHYPGPTGPNKYRNSKRPVTFDEFCHLNAYNRLELAADPGLRSMWGPLLDQMWNDMYHSQGVLGGAIWAGIDDTFFLPGEKAVGYGTWGLLPNGEPYRLLPCRSFPQLSTRWYIPTDH